MSHANAGLKELLRNELKTRYNLNPTDQWLTAFLSTISRPPPLPALTSTAHFRLTSTDFTAALTARPPHILPANIGDAQIKDTILQGNIPVQVLDIIDTSTSKYSQIEAIERVERGEEIRGREVIRNITVADDDGDDSTLGGRTQRNSSRPSGTASTASNNTKKGSTGPHKLLLQDAAGTKVWAFELSRIDRITIINAGPTAPGATTQTPIEGMQIGCKLLLKSGTSVRRGLIMLTPAHTTIMGGKVEAWDKKWREVRKTRLQQDLEAENAA